MITEGNVKIPDKKQNNQPCSGMMLLYTCRFKWIQEVHIASIGPCPLKRNE